MHIIAVGYWLIKAAIADWQSSQWMSFYSWLC